MAEREWETPCADERYMAHFGLQVDPWDLDQCVECELDGGCAVHLCQRDEASIVLHADWFMAFASPGEPQCGHVGGPAHLVPSEGTVACQKVAGHDGTHRARMGWSWPVAPSVLETVSNPREGV